MKNLLLIAIFLGCTSIIWSQSQVTLSGGYAFANIEDFDSSANGWRINSLYEYIPTGSNIAHGFAIGHISTSGSSSDDAEKVTIDLSNVPIYYAPKIMFGSDKAKGFAKAALGVHFSKYDVKSNVSASPYAGSISTNDVGFYGGLGIGGLLFVNDKIFINLEYEWAYLSNSYYRDGFMNSVMLGLGFKF